MKTKFVYMYITLHEHTVTCLEGGTKKSWTHIHKQPHWCDFIATQHEASMCTVGMQWEKQPDSDSPTKSDALPSSDIRHRREESSDESDSDPQEVDSDSDYSPSSSNEEGDYEMSLLASER